MDALFHMKRADLLKYGALVVLVVQNSTLALTMRYSRSSGDTLYISSTAVVMSELVKLVAASCLIGVEEGSTHGLWNRLYREVVCMPADFAKLLIPACLYTLQNNLAYIAVSNLDAATYQVLYQLKILTTAIFSVVLLRRHLDFFKWLSLLVLVGGVSLVQLSGMKSGAEAANVAMGNMTIGLLAVILACCSSGFAGVYFEKVLKGSEISVWVRNVELALIGIVVGLAGVWYSDADLVGQHGFFYGYSPLVWSVIALQALGGIVVALVVKHADSLLKGFSTAISIVISCLVSYALFGEVSLSPKFVMGVALVICSTIMYSVNPIELCCPASAPSKGLGGRGGLLLPTSGYGGKLHDGKLERIPLTEVLHDDDADSDVESTSSGSAEEYIEEEAISDGSRGASLRGQHHRRSLLS